MSMSTIAAILHVVGCMSNVYCIKCKIRTFVNKSGENAQKRTNFPKICSFTIDSYYRLLYPTILTMSEGI